MSSAATETKSQATPSDSTGLTPEQQFVATALEYADAAKGIGSDALQRLRAAGRDAFAAAELPHRRTEAWKYSRVRPLLLPGLLDRSAGSSESSDGAAAEPDTIDDFDALRLILTEGELPASLPQLPGVSLARLGDAEGASAAVFEAHLGGLLDVADRPFVALNACLLDDVLLVHVTGIAARPLQLDFLQRQTDAPRGSQPRVLVVLEPGAELTLLERYEGTAAVFHNQVVEVMIGAGAHLEHVRAQLEGGEARSLCALEVSLDRDARYTLHEVSLGAVFKRNEIGIRLAGPGAEARVNGAFLTRGSDHVDHQMNVQHIAPHCQSDQMFRGMAGERSRGVLNGRIHIHPGAQKSLAELSSKNLLLTPGAEIDAKPELEIYADDVKCAHGATVGRLDDKALYYLRSRGIEEAQARTMLSFAFMGSVIDRLPHPALRDWLRPRVEAAFAAPAPMDAAQRGGDA